MDRLTTTLLLSLLTMNFFHWFYEKIVLKLYGTQKLGEQERIARREVMTRGGW